MGTATLVNGNALMSLFCADTSTQFECNRAMRPFYLYVSLDFINFAQNL